MSQTQKVIDRLKQLLGCKWDLELADLLEIAPNKLSSWKVRDSIQYGEIIDLCKRKKIDLNEVFFADSGSNVVLDDRKVRMVSVENQLGYFLNPEQYCLSSPVYSFPTLKKIDMAFQVGVNNLHPTIKTSSYVLAKKIELEEIKSLELYVLVVQDRGILFYRFKEYTTEGELVFMCDNPIFEPFIVQPTKIVEIFSIHGAFMPNINSLF